MSDSLPPPTSDPLGLLVDGGGGGRTERDSVGVLRLSDSSDDESGGLMTASHGQISSLLSTADPSEADRLRQQSSRVCSHL